MIFFIIFAGTPAITVPKEYSPRTTEFAPTTTCSAKIVPASITLPTPRNEFEPIYVPLDSLLARDITDLLISLYE